MEAYRYPEDYNGISAMAPANPMVDLMIGTVWTGYVAMKDEARRLTMSNMMAVQKAFIEQCDARDGLKDGIVADPEDCHFDPASLECKGTPSEGCLTAPQVEALHDIYAGPKNPRTGAQTFAGYEPGSEQQLMVLDGGKEPFPVATSYFRDLVFHDPKWDFKSYNYDTDLAASYKAGSDILDVPSDGLAAYLAGGGKLLLSHGWSDGLIPAPNTVAYYKAVEAELPEEETADSVRLFMIPGMGHCGGGDAPTVTDMLSVIDGWVETGKAAGDHHRQRVLRSKSLPRGRSALIRSMRDTKGRGMRTMRRALCVQTGNQRGDQYIDEIDFDAAGSRATFLPSGRKICGTRRTAASLRDSEVNQGYRLPHAEARG